LISSKTSSEEFLLYLLNFKELDIHKLVLINSTLVMKKAILIISLVMCFNLGNTQTKQKDTIQLKKVLELQIKGEGGANGASVAWNPMLKKYYCAIAGNADFPMSVFNATGTLVSDSTLKTQIDVRGLWYNTRTKTLQANGYDDAGWITYKLDSKGIPISFTNLFEGLNQPNEQSVGVFDAAGNVLYFYDNLEVPEITKYSMTDAKSVSTISLHPGTKFEEDIDEDWDLESMFDYNSTTVVYTGIPKSEFGMLNIELIQIELYNADGLLTKVLLLPSDTPTYEMFNFSYCNGIYWLFDKDNRKWIGYK
jgi:hypothetical protein